MVRLLVCCVLSGAALSGTFAIAAPQLIVLNADVYTVDPAAPRVSAFAVAQGRFVAVGDDETIGALVGDETRVIDAGGRTVTPGFIDGHAHVSGNSRPVAGVDLAYVADKDLWLQRIAEADDRMPAGEWITGGGWDHTLSDGKFPTLAMLDAVVPERPVFLSHIDGHYAWVNTKALELAGVTAETVVPPGGEIVLDAQTGKPLGVLLEGAQSLVRRVIPERSDHQRQEGLAAMERYANSLGVTGLHQMGGLADYLHVVEQGTPTLRIWYGHWGPEGTGADYDRGLEEILDTQAEIEARVAATAREADVGPLLRVGFVKLINDGVLSAHTAVLMEDYADRPGWRGEYITAPEELSIQVQKVTAAGLPVAVHSIGDAAVHATLDAFEAARNNPVPFPNRIEHIELVDPSDVPRFRALGVVASMQPDHATNAIGYVPERVGPARESRAYLWKSMLDAGVPLVFGADYGTSPLDPLFQIADAVFRESPFGFNDGKPWHPEQAVSFEEALHAYTQAGANITPWKDQIGSITPGKWADFVLLDGVVPAPMSAEFRKLAVARTFFAGREVYAKDEASERGD
ncbi:MAG: amidohydrolase [Pseudomonadales bacterium]|jgi:predicted amidohydrolase YtcJ|nr:amidohydrolase [Pseudomonadales bacterium]